MRNRLSRLTRAERVVTIRAEPISATIRIPIPMSPTIIEQFAEQRVERMRRFYAPLSPSVANVRQAIVDMAASFAYVAEIGTTNTGYWVNKFLKDCKLGGGHPWCMAYAQWPILYVSQMWSKPDLLPYDSASTMSVYNYAEKLGCTAATLAEIMIGDLIFWADGTSGKGHVGIIVAVRMDHVGQLTIAVAEGNTSAASWRDGGLVAVKSYVLTAKSFTKSTSARYVRGIVRIDNLMEKNW